jgi:ClpP class serine protease
MFTEKGFTKEHRLNVQNLVDHIDGNKRDNIVADRNTKGFDQVVWKMIRKHGTFTGPETLKLGLVDHLPKLDPLDGLLESNKNKESKDSMKNKWGNQTDLEKFEATERISFIKYRSLLSQKKKMEKRKAHTYQRLKKMAESSSAMEATLNAAGFRAPYFNYTPVSSVSFLAGFSLSHLTFVMLVVSSG